MIGLAIAVLLALADIAGPFTIPAPAAAQPGAPTWVLIVSAGLGALTLAAVVFTWRTGSRIGSHLVAATRVLSAFSSIPAFTGTDVQADLAVTAAAGIALTLISACLVLFGRPPTR